MARRFEEDETQKKEKELDEHYDFKGRLKVLNFEARTCGVCGCLVVQTRGIVDTHLEWHEHLEAQAAKIVSLEAAVESLQNCLRELKGEVSATPFSEMKW